MQLQQRNSMSAMHVKLSIKAGNWSCNSLNNADVVQSIVVLTVSAKKASDIRGSFNVTYLCVTRKPLRAFITLQKATHLTVSAKRRCIKWKISNFSSSTPVHRLLCSKTPQNLYKLHMLRNYSSLATFLLLTSSHALSALKTTTYIC